MRNYTEIRFSDTTGNGKFSGKPDLPSEIFFLGARCNPPCPLLLVSREQRDSFTPLQCHTGTVPLPARRLTHVAGLEEDLSTGRRGARRARERRTAGSAAGTRGRVKFVFLFPATGSLLELPRREDGHWLGRRRRGDRRFALSSSLLRESRSWIIMGRQWGSTIAAEVLCHGRHGALCSCTAPGGKGPEQTPA